MIPTRGYCELQMYIRQHWIVYAKNKRGSVASATIAVQSYFSCWNKPFENYFLSHNALNCYLCQSTNPGGCFPRDILHQSSSSWRIHRRHAPSHWAPCFRQEQSSNLLLHCKRICSKVWCHSVQLSAGSFEGRTLLTRHCMTPYHACCQTFLASSNNSNRGLYIKLCSPLLLPWRTRCRGDPNQRSVRCGLIPGS